MAGFQDNHLDFLSGLEADPSYFMARSMTSVSVMVAENISTASVWFSYLSHKTILLSNKAGITIINFGGNYSRLCLGFNFISMKS